MTEADNRAEVLRGAGRRAVWGLSAAVALVATSGCGSPALDVQAAPAALAAERGQRWYEAYCAECHGPQARGDGALAIGMLPRPADLTAIAARRGGFSAERVTAYIDGREYVAQHGPREMPVWGRRFDDRLEPSLEQELRLSPQMIAEIAAYLELQQDTHSRR